MNPYPRNRPCDERAHQWVRETLTVLVPEEDSLPHTYASERCTQCGAIRRARDASGTLIGNDA